MRRYAMLTLCSTALSCVVQSCAVLDYVFQTREKAHKQRKNEKPRRRDAKKRSQVRRLCAYIFTQIYMCICAHVHMCICVCVYVCICVYVYMCMCMHMYVYMYM